MKTIKKISLLVLVCSLFVMMILSNSNIQQLGYSNVIKSINYNEGNNSSNITFEEKQVFEGIETTFNSTSIQGSTSVNSSAAPFVYTNLDLFSGKTLTKIGIPVKTVKVLDENQTFTLYVVDKTNVSSGKATTANKTYTLKLPLDQLGSSTTVNNWVYVDLSSYDITVGENETLAFSSSSDTVKWGYKTGGTEEYRFWKTVFTSASLLSSYNIYFDVYYSETENCYVVDLFADSGINSENFKTYMGDAGLHPNVDGMNLISKTFVKKLEDVYLEKDNNNNENENENENQEEIENPFTSTSLIKIISLILIVGSIIVLINTFKNTKINKYE